MQTPNCVERDSEIERKMEGYKHFSHTHNLNHHQVPQGTQITCSGCKSQAIGTIYACWQCNFFLHENCYIATRSLQHPSHPFHPLTLVPYPTYPSSSFYCNTCTLIGTGFSYSCSNCEFDIHIQCAYNNSSQQNPSLPNQTSNLIHNNSMPNHFQTLNAATNAFMPHQAVTHSTSNYTTRAPSASSKPEKETREILHKSHPNHPLTLLSPPPYEGSTFTCNACEEDGSDSTYHCATCHFDLHVECASLIDVVKREDHKHPLKLTFSCPIQAEGNSFECDVCYSDISKNCWIFYCKRCDFGCHTYCVNSEACDAEDLADRLAATKITAKIEDDCREAALDLWDSPGTKYKYKYKHDDDLW